MNGSNTNGVLQQWEDPPVNRVMRSILLGEMSPEHRIIFDHEGGVGGELIGLLLDQAEKHSILVDDAISVRKRLFSVLVEGLENIHRHGSGSGKDAAAVLLDTPAGYEVLLGNVVPVILGAMMETRVDLLNMMEEEVLKEHYMKLLSNEGRTEKGGAGLGLLTMARKSTRPIQVHVISLGDDLACMVLQIRVARPQ